MRFLILFIFVIISLISCKRKGFDTSQKIEIPVYKIDEPAFLKSISTRDSIKFEGYGKEMTSGYFENTSVRKIMLVYYLDSVKTDYEQAIPEIKKVIELNAKEHIKNLKDFEIIEVTFKTASKTIAVEKIVLEKGENQEN